MSAKGGSCVTATMRARSAGLSACAGSARTVSGRRSPRANPSLARQRCSVRGSMPASAQAPAVPRPHEGVQRPPEGDESSVSAWLEKLLTFAMAQKLSAYIDLGGGDTTLGRPVLEGGA